MNKRTFSRKRRICCGFLAAVTAAACFGSTALAEDQKIARAPSGLMALSNGTLLVTDTYQKAIWIMDPDGTYTKLAGREGVRDANGDPIGGYYDGTAKEAAFEEPWAAALYLEGYAVSDTENHVIRYISGGKAATIAGSGQVGLSDGSGVQAAFSRPTGLAQGPEGSLFVADTGNNAIRRISADGKVTTYAGGAAGSAVGALKQARFNEPTGLCYSDGILYVADSGNHRILKIEKDIVSVLAGGAPSEVPEEAVLRDGAAAQAQFFNPQGVLAHDGVVYVADTGNGAVRRIKDGEVTTLMAMGGGTAGMYPISPRAMALVNGKLYVGDVFSRVLFTVPLTGGSRFSDVASDDWYAAAAELVSGKGIMNGISKTQFGPEELMNRAMTVTVLMQMEKSLNPAGNYEGLSVFPDVPKDSYYAAAAAWAAKENVAKGEGGKFYPDRIITRAELVTMLYNYALGSEKAVEQTQVELSGYSDAAQLPQWSAEPFGWACNAGIVSGKPGNRLAPQEPATRAEMAVILQKYLSWQDLPK